MRPLQSLNRQVKFSPRYAKVFIRTKRLYMLDEDREDLEIIDLTTTLARAPTRPHRSRSTPQKKDKLDCDELDAL